MKVLFVLRRPGTLRSFAATISLLAERGHTVDVRFSRLRDKSMGPEELGPARALAERFANVTYGEAPGRNPADGWTRIARTVRTWGDFSRYAHPRFADAPLLKERATHKAKRRFRKSAAMGRLADGIAKLDSAPAAGALEGFFRQLEGAIPPSTSLAAWLRGQGYDAVLVSPLVDHGSDQADIVKAAQLARIPTGALITSWDNLTTKGVIRVRPDRVFVWNETQRREAGEMHGVPPGRVVVTGAPRFDPWFARTPSRPREAFLAEAGLPPGRPYVLYLCSSPFIAPDEVPFVTRWVKAVRAAVDTEILVRPYPQNAHLWNGVDVGAAIWPREGRYVDDEASAADFYDAIAYSEVVVGINTSALIEAAIAGKNVLTVADADFAGTQRGTLHYHYLLYENGGFLREAAGLAEHVRQLQGALDGQDADAEQTRRFVTSFVRPLGPEVEASVTLADEIEVLAALPASPPRRGAASWLLHAGLAPAAALRRRRAAHSA
ncbi:MAG: hypothetical protein ACM3QU_03225 [Verrucomicrobiota bacterium]